MATRAGSWIKTGKPQLFLAALGKHPAWDDHMEVGLESEALVRVRRQLYVEGIGAAIDSGAWDKLAPDEVLPAFGHTFLWRFDQELVVGRMWASKDGKGRARYPMLACFHATGVGAGWALRELSPRLERLEAACAAATTQQGVEEAIATERTAARGALERESPEAVRTPLAPDLASLAAAPELGPDRRGLQRILYEGERELTPWRDAVDSKSSRSGVVNLTGHRLRVPGLGANAASTLARWAGVGFSLVADSAPVFAVMPKSGAWVDLIVGDLSAAHLACLKITPRKMALTSDVPYTLDEAFVARANARIDAREPPSVEPPPTTGASRARPAWLKWAGLGAVGVGVVVGGVLIAGGGGTPSPQPVATPPAPLREPEKPAPAPATPAPQIAAAPPSPPASTPAESNSPKPIASETTTPESAPAPVAAAPEPAGASASFRDQLPVAVGEGAVASAWRRGLDQIEAGGAPTARAAAQGEAWHTLLLILAEAPRAEGVSAEDRSALDAARERAWAAALERAGDAHAATAIASAQARVRAGLELEAQRCAEREALAARAAAALRALGEADAAAAPGIPETVRELESKLELAAGVPSADRLSAEIRSWRAQAARAPTELATEARDPSASPWRRVAAWRRLGEKDWPSSPLQLREEVAIQREIGALPAVAPLASERRSESERRWLRVANAAGTDAASVRDTMAQLVALALPESVVAKAPRDFQIARASLELRDAIARPEIDDAAARSAVEAFLSASAAAGGSAWDDGLRKAIAPPRSAPPLGGVGPGSAGWRAEPNDDGSRVKYVSPRGRSPIEFIRLEGIGGSDASTYLSAGEVSLGQFIEIAAGAWDTIKTLLPQFDQHDPRLGPRVWTWAKEGEDPIRPAASSAGTSRGWIAPTRRTTSYYAADPGTGPGLSHPMQHLSARAAVAAARAVGCRLPSSTEWRAAVNLGPAPARNLRDPTWAAQWRFLHDEGSVDEREWPGAGIFWPIDVDAKRPGEDGAAATNDDDGVLWFAEATGAQQATSPAGFTHLIGNVAEWVFEAPETLEAIDAVTTRSIAQAMGDGSMLRVIGASALSPPGLEEAVPLRIDPRRARDGFSDVGFRLAFTVRGMFGQDDSRPLPARVRELLHSYR